ncbi:MAG: hypothetical protein IKN59_05140 [Paludibacteraceae bacterium]|nr:hypothetical protein [Paludibacteraceae bacterium]
MKKTFGQPKLNVIFINKNINTITVSNTVRNSVDGDAPDRMGRESWDAGY